MSRQRRKIYKATPAMLGKFPMMDTMLHTKKCTNLFNVIYANFFAFSAALEALFALKAALPDSVFRK